MNLTSSSDYDSEALLLQQVEQGCRQAFTVLYEKYWEHAFNGAYKRLKDADQAKDIVQEIFLSIWLNRETHIENFPAYLNIAVRNRVLKLVEKQKATNPFLDNLHQMPPSHLRADSAILQKEFLSGYEALLTTLPSKRQQIFRLRFQEDLPTKAIAAQLNLSLKTIQNQLGKAIEQLRVSLFQL